jgi:hypothetical protein
MGLSLQESRFGSLHHTEQHTPVGRLATVFPCLFGFQKRQFTTDSSTLQMSRCAHG